MTTDTEFERIDNDTSRMSLASNQVESIAPTRGVAEQRVEYNKRKEIADKLREEKIAKQKENDEAGLAEDQTNLPLEMLMKAKME